MTVIRDGVEWYEISTLLSLRSVSYYLIVMFSTFVFLTAVFLTSDTSGQMIDTLMVLTTICMAPFLFLVYQHIKHKKLGHFRFDRGKLVIDPEYGDEIMLSREQVVSFEPVNAPMFDHAHRLTYRPSLEEKHERRFNFDKNSVIPVRDWLLED